MIQIIKIIIASFYGELASICDYINAENLEKNYIPLFHMFQYSHGIHHCLIMTK